MERNLGHAVHTIARSDVVLFFAGREIGNWQELEYHEALRLGRERGGFRHAPGRLAGAGLAETWNTLDYLAEAGIRYVCDLVNDD